jgi:hypothetical protein
VRAVHARRVPALEDGDESERLTMSHRLLGQACLALFTISTAFPVAAGLLGVGDKPRWLGLADVVVAAVTFATAALVASRGRAIAEDRHRVRAFRVTQGILSSIPILLVAFFALGERVDWTVLVIGLAWRGWLLVYTMPFLLATLERDQ